MLVWIILTSPLALVLQIPFIGMWVVDGYWFTELFTENAVMEMAEK